MKRVVKPKPKVYIPQNLFRKTLTVYHQNSFVKLLTRLYGETKALELCNQFRLGTSNHFDDGCIFWFLDELKNVVAGQIVSFDEDGHTSKWSNGKKKINWVHSVYRNQLNKSNMEVPTWLTTYCDQDLKCSCLYGLQQLHEHPNKTIAIVEAPKTSVIAAGVFPEYIWMATRSLSGLKADRLEVLKDREVIFFPDKDVYTKWSETLSRIKLPDFQYSISDLLEKKNAESGSDIADYIISELNQN